MTLSTVALTLLYSSSEHDEFSGSALPLLDVRRDVVKPRDGGVEIVVERGIFDEFADACPGHLNLVGDALEVAGDDVESIEQVGAALDHFRHGDWRERRE